jgi:hypothetical protein
VTRYPPIPSLKISRPTDDAISFLSVSITAPPGHQRGAYTP